MVEVHCARLEAAAAVRAWNVTELRQKGRLLAPSLAR